MRAVEVVVVEVEREESGAVVNGVVGAGVSPLASDGLDEALGLAVGLRAIGSCEEMAEAQLVAGSGEELGTISRAAVGEDALDEDAVSLIEGDGLVESGQNAGSFFVWEQRGKSQAGMIIDGDVEGLDTGAWIALGTVAGGTDAGLVKAAKLFNIKMKELAGGIAFVTPDRRLRRIEGGQAIEAMTSEDAGKGSFGDGKNHEDLRVRTALAAESENLVFELWRGLAWLTPRDGGEVLQTLMGAGLLGTFEPLADGFIGDGERGGGGAQRGAAGVVVMNQFGSHERGECGISVHVVRGV